MRFIFVISLFLFTPSCVPILISKSIKESKRIEQEAIEVFAKHQLTLKFDQSAHSQRESSIYSEDGKELIFMQRFVEHYQTRSQVSDNNWRRRTYFHVVFLESKKKIALQRFSVYNVIMTLEQNNIFEFGGLNNNAIDYLALKYGVNNLVK